MTRKQAVIIIAINAAISVLISVAVAFLIIRPAQISLGPLPTSVVPVETQSPTEATLTPETVIHVVQSGDTISGLALQYDVPGEDIIAANQLENPNFLQVGASLVIPVGGLIEATATFTPEPTPTETDIPYEPPSTDMTATASAEVVATEVVQPTQPPETVEGDIVIFEIVGAGDIAQEQVTLLNNGARPVDLLGWTLSDPDGNTYTFPKLLLFSNGSAVVNTRVGQDGSPTFNFYWGKLEANWSLGETITLMNAEGEVVSTYVVRQ
jgi:LysM repeat protein